MRPLPSERGTYALVFTLEEPVRLTAGALGERELGAGTLVYVGSAFGPGGLRARVGRHLAGAARRHWHVDHLRAVAAPRLAAVCAAPARLECRWVAALQARAGAGSPWPGFGASDCRCASHLLELQSTGDVARVLRRALRAGRQQHAIRLFSVRIDEVGVEPPGRSRGGERKTAENALDVP